MFEMKSFLREKYESLSSLLQSGLGLALFPFLFVGGIINEYVLVPLLRLWKKIRLFVLIPTMSCVVILGLLDAESKSPPGPTSLTGAMLINDSSWKPMLPYYVQPKPSALAIKYAKDDRTGLCFAMEGTWVTNVPCDAVEEFLD